MGELRRDGDLAQEPITPNYRREIGIEFFQRSADMWNFPSVVESFLYIVYNPKKIASWDRPLEVGIGGAEWINLESIVLVK